MITSKFKSLIVAIMLLVVGGIVQNAAAAGPRKAWSESDGVYYLKTTDGQEDTYAVDSTLTFKAVAEIRFPATATVALFSSQPKRVTSCASQSTALTCQGATTCCSTMVQCRV